LGLEELLNILTELLWRRVLAILIFEVLTCCVFQKVADKNMTIKSKHLTLSFGFQLEVVILVRSSPNLEEHGHDHVLLFKLLDVEDALDPQLEFALVKLGCRLVPVNGFLGLGRCDLLDR